MRRNGTSFVSTKHWDTALDTLLGTYEFDSNPLLAAKTDAQMQTIMDNVADYAEELRFCPFNVKFNGNPAIQCGDYVYLEPGGGIDETQYRHYGIVTYYKWKYRGASEIRCATDIAGELPSSVYEEAQGISAMSAKPRVASETESEQYPLKAKSQIEKRIDGIGDTCMALVSSVQKPYWELKNDNAVLRMYDPGGQKSGRITMHNTEIRLETENGCRILLYKDACCRGAYRDLWRFAGKRGQDQRRDLKRRWWATSSARALRTAI